MKWGRRKHYETHEKDKIRSETFEDNRSKKELKKDRKFMKKALIIGFSILAAGAAIHYARKISYERHLSKIKSMSVDDAKTALYKAKKDLEFCLSKDIELKRQIGYDKFDINKTRGFIYTAFDKGDVNKYRHELKDWTGTGKRYEVTFQLQKDLKIPSEKTVNNIYKELIAKDKNYKKDIYKDLYRSFVVAYKKQGIDPYSKEGQRLIRNDIKVRRYLFKPKDIASYTMVRQSNSAKKLSKAIRQKGYDAVMDYFDKGLFTEAPLIILNKNVIRQKSIKYVGVT